MFDPKNKVTKMQGKDYLEVKWRMVWFRDEHPKGKIITELLTEGIVKASVFDNDGNLMSTGHGTPKMQGVAKSRPVEGAETAAIGRALAHAGYGTQFTDEDEGEHLADAPVEPHKKSIRELYAERLTEAEALGIATLDYQVNDKMADEEIMVLGKELRAKVDAKKAGK